MIRSTTKIEIDRLVAAWKDVSRVRSYLCNRSTTGDRARPVSIIFREGKETERKIREVKVTVPFPITIDVKAWMARHGRIGQVKGDGSNLQTGSWVALGPVFTEHLVPIIPALPPLFDH
eukprot:2878696-Heterocapsa_arctica.AAC.1